MNYVISIGLVVVFAGFLYFVLRSVKNSGKVEERSATQAEVLHDVQDAEKIHDRLRNDPDYAKRVRERFTRP